MEHLPPLPSGIRTLTDPESTRLRATYSPSQLPPTPAQCVTCDGTKSFLWWSQEDPNEAVQYECPCEDQWVLHRYLLHSGIGITYQRYGWDDVHAEPDAVKVVRDYMEAGISNVHAGLGLALLGTNGNGKTLLGTLALKHLMALGLDGYWISFTKMLDSNSLGWRDEEAQRWFERRIRNADVLLIDDVGKEMQGTRLPEPVFDDILRHRVAFGLPTIITTNDTMEMLRAKYQGSVIDLLLESATVHSFTGPSYREKRNQAVRLESQLGLRRPVRVG